MTPMATASLTGVRHITKKTKYFTIYIHMKTLTCCVCASISYTYMSVHTNNK